MSPGASAVGRTFRLLAVGVAAGIVTSLAALFPIYALRGHPEAITVPPLWVAGAFTSALAAVTWLAVARPGSARGHTS